MMILNILASFFSGMLGSMGFGGGGILILYLTLVLNMEQVTAQGINLIFFIPCAITGLIIHIKHNLIDFKKVVPYILLAIPGVILGLYLTNIISNEWLSKIFGALLLVLGVKQLFAKNKTDMTK